MNIQQYMQRLPSFSNSLALRNISYTEISFAVLQWFQTALWVSHRPFNSRLASHFSMPHPYHPRRLYRAGHLTGGGSFSLLSKATKIPPETGVENGFIAPLSFPLHQLAQARVKIGSHQHKWFFIRARNYLSLLSWSSSFRPQESVRMMVFVRSLERRSSRVQLVHMEHAVAGYWL